jgi:hypothetical protein
MIFRFTINFGYWRHIYLDLISQFKVTNFSHSKLLLKILVTHNMKNVISLKVRILGSNLFLTRESTVNFGLFGFCQLATECAVLITRDQQ